MRITALLIYLSAACLFLPRQQPTSKSGTNTQPNPPAPQKTEQPKPAPKRVRTDLSAFELDKSRPQPGTQIGGATRGSEALTILLAPQLTKHYTLRPVFRWEQHNKANSFDFRVMDDSGQQVYTATVTGTSFEYPENAPALKPGQTYSWTVAPEVSLLGGAAAPARFVVIGNPERAQVNSELAGEAVTADARARIFAQHGLWYDAVEAYTGLIRSHPDNAEFYERRAEIYEQLPVTQELARADRERAAILQRHSP